MQPVNCRSVDMDTWHYPTNAEGMCKETFFPHVVAVGEGGASSVTLRFVFYYFSFGTVPLCQSLSQGLENRAR